MKYFPCATLSEKSDVDYLGIEPGPLQWEASGLVHEPWHGPVSLERYANRVAYYTVQQIFIDVMLLR